jgi:hypothetical protein
MYLLFRHSEERFNPNRADLSPAQEIQKILEGNPDFRGQVLRAMETLIERMGKTRTRRTPPQEGQDLFLPNVAPPIWHRHQTEQGTFPMELTQILDI